MIVKIWVLLFLQYGDVQKETLLSAGTVNDAEQIQER